MEAGERIVVSYPHDSNFNRGGILLEVVETKNCKNIWAIRLDATDSLPAAIAKYNEVWLIKKDWKESKVKETKTKFLVIKNPMRSKFKTPPPVAFLGIFDTEKQALLWIRDQEHEERLTIKEIPYFK